MNVIVIANPKGGVGKSTLSTNLAGYFARQGEAVMLGDVDRQQSARDWLSIRPATLPVIRSWDLQPDEPARRKALRRSSSTRRPACTARCSTACSRRRRISSCRCSRPCSTSWRRATFSTPCAK